MKAMGKGVDVKFSDRYCVNRAETHKKTSV